MRFMVDSRDGRYMDTEPRRQGAGISGFTGVQHRRFRSIEGLTSRPINIRPFNADLSTHTLTRKYRRGFEILGLILDDKRISEKTHTGRSVQGFLNLAEHFNES